MKETYNFQAIVLNRQTYREVDSKIILFSEIQGKLELIARGTKKISSKLAAHVEPFNLSNVMAVRGKKYDYVGTAVTIDSFIRLKEDINSLYYAGQGIGYFNKLTRMDETSDPELLFQLLKNFLQYTQIADNKETILYFFLFKLIFALGFYPEINNCIKCKKDISRDIYFDYQHGGVICSNCKDINAIKISNYTYSFLKNCLKINFKDIDKINNVDSDEIRNIFDNFYKYHLSF